MCVSVRSRAGHDINYLALAGVLSAHAQPQPPPVQVADLAGGSWPAVAQIVLTLALFGCCCCCVFSECFCVLQIAALLRRQRTGTGCYIDVSMADNAYALNVFGILSFDRFSVWTITRSALFRLCHRRFLAARARGITKAVLHTGRCRRYCAAAGDITNGRGTLLSGI